MTVRELRDVLNKLPNELLDLEAVSYDNGDHTLIGIGVLEVVSGKKGSCMSISAFSKYEDEQLQEDIDLQLLLKE